MSAVEIKENFNLAPLTYYKIGGPARYFAQPTSVDELRELALFIRTNKIPYFVLGAGSNILVDDAGFNGLIIHTAKLNSNLVQTGDKIKAGASVMVIHLLRHCMQNGVKGFEFLVGIPGNLGGAICMNAGTKLGEVDGAILQVTTFDLASGEERVINRGEIKYSYRAQHFLKPHEVVLSGEFQATKAEPKSVQDEIQKLLLARKASQPIDKPSCGSVFKNPSPTLHAWKVIADVGLRGYRIGNAQFSELHTNFIVNLGKATAADVRALITEAKARALKQFKVELEEEVRILDSGACSGKTL